MKVVNNLRKEKEVARIQRGDAVLFKYDGEEQLGILYKTKNDTLAVLMPSGNFNRWTSAEYKNGMPVDEFIEKFTTDEKCVEVIPRDKIKVTFEFVNDLQTK